MIDAARQVGSRSHAILAGLGGGLFEACSGGAGDTCLAVLKIAGAALVTGFCYALGAGVASAIVAWWRRPAA